MPAWSAAVGDTPGGAGLVVLAPSPRELADDGWLARGIAEVAAAAAAGGAGFVLVPPGPRRRIHRRLRREVDLHVEPLILVPDAKSPAFVAPPTAAALRYVAAEAATLPPAARRCVARLARLKSFRQFATAVLPSAGFLVWHPRAEPFGWLTRHAGGAHDVVLRPGWRGGDTPTVVVAVGPHSPAPALIAKVASGPTSAAACLREADHLRGLGRTAEAAGARVPRLVSVVDVGGNPAVLQTAVVGRPARLALSSYHRGRAALDSLFEWLLRWNVATRSDVVFDQEHVARWILEPLDVLEGDLLHPGYAKLLRERAEALLGTSVPLVAAHHDLTASNVILDGRAGPGIIDWAEAEERALPLTDLFYAAVDFHVRRQGGSRVKAYHALLANPHRGSGELEAWVARFADALDLSPGLVDLAFHACWLRHARNESAGAAARTRERPFLDLLKLVAAGSLRDAPGGDLEWSR